VTDLGYIKWKTDLVELTTESQTDFNGQSLQDVYEENISFEDLMEQFGDSLFQSIKVTESPAPFTTYLPARVTVAGSFDVTKFLSFGLLSQTKFIGKQAHESLTLSTNLNFGNAFSTTFAYTAANMRYDNLRLGLAFRGGYFQFFALIDNIPLKWSNVTTGEGSSFPMPEHLNTIHARLGMNLVFGNRAKEKLADEE